MNRTWRLAQHNLLRASRSCFRTVRDEKTYHDEAIARLQAEHKRLQNRIDTMYVDKLDGRIDCAFFDRKSGEWRAEQARLMRSLEEHQSANHAYIEEGIQLLDLARRAQDLFLKQPPSSKRRLLDFVLSNCSWKHGELTAEFRQPFDIIAAAATADVAKTAAGTGYNGRFYNWLPDLTICEPLHSRYRNESLSLAAAELGEPVSRNDQARGDLINRYSRSRRW